MHETARVIVQRCLAHLRRALDQSLPAVDLARVVTSQIPHLEHADRLMDAHHADVTRLVRRAVETAARERRSIDEALREIVALLTPHQDASPEVAAALRVALAKLGQSPADLEPDDT